MSSYLYTSSDINSDFDTDYKLHLSDLLLSTITVEAKISNVKFKEYVFINHLLRLIKDQDEHINSIGLLEYFNTYTMSNNINLDDVQLNELITPNAKDFKLSPNILKIGCNYAEYISERYIDMTTVVKKSNRGRKKKEKKKSNRKVQGNGKYFNSQITFTILDNQIEKKMYDIKLFTNGTIQIPSVCNEDLTTVYYLIDYVIEIINLFTYIKPDPNEKIEITYIKSIMRNYKFSTTNHNLFIDLKKFQRFILHFKNFLSTAISNSDSDSVEDTEIYIPCIDTSLYQKYLKDITSLTLTLVKHSSERYVGFLIKFKTPTESNPNKASTVKIFSSGKFNLDGCNNIEQGMQITNILYILMNIGKHYIFYFKN